MNVNKKSIVVVLLLLSLLMGVVAVGAAVNDLEISSNTLSLWSISFVVLTIIWVHKDSQQKKFQTPFEFGFLMYVLWPIVFPWYLVSTRGSRGLVSFAGFLSLYLGPWVCALIIYVSKY